MHQPYHRLAAGTRATRLCGRALADEDMGPVGRPPLSEPFVRSVRPTRLGLEVYAHLVGREASAFLPAHRQSYRKRSPTKAPSSEFHDGIVGCAAAIEKDLEQVRAQCVELRARRHRAIGGDQLIYGRVDAAG